MGLILSLLLVAVATWVGMTYNRLVALRNRWRNAFAQIDVQLKRRHDLIPNLVETAKGYLKHERETLESVVQARAAAVGARDAAAAAPGDARAMQGLAGAEAVLGGALGRLMAVVEAYPELKADATMAQLSEELTSTENRIAFARQAFNDDVTGYNDQVEQFPGNLVAGAFGFPRAEQLAATGSRAERTAPAVKF
ncbi:MAG: LemA family protein [Burkholderiaceae bacterium]|jgi:LemA protein|nr:LemA family protein [Burkholderiales bacterium]MCZ8107648.1 LemA family protein [Burkholderiales bacterium]MCZ8340327.1 LemA family protein [Burkholderiaceae bacterium]